LALVGGSVAALIQFLFGPFVEPLGFELSRWMNGFVDIVTVPALMPILLCAFFIIFRLIKKDTEFFQNLDFTAFALLWLIPTGAVRAFGWSAQSDPAHLILAPILWASIAIGVPFFIDFYKYRHVLVIIPASLGVLIIPFAATSAYWAFYGQDTFFGYIFLLVAAAPMLVATVLSIIRAER